MSARDRNVGALAVFAVDDGAAAVCKILKAPLVVATCCRQLIFLA